MENYLYAVSTTNSQCCTLLLLYDDGASAMAQFDIDEQQMYLFSYANGL